MQEYTLKINYQRYTYSFVFRNSRRMDVSKFVFRSPATCLVTGPTGCGKTCLLLNILKEIELFEQKPTKIIWCYSVYQEKFNAYKDIIHFHDGLYDVKSLENVQGHKIVILDDLMHKLNEDVAETFTVYSHHLNISVFFITQNIFHQSKYMRDVSLNTQYLILFGQRRDTSQINVLASQMFPSQRKEFLKVYKEVTSKPHGYLLCELHPKNTYRVLLRTNILPYEIETVYIPE